MAHIAVIIGVGGGERYLAHAPVGTDARAKHRLIEVRERAGARRFRSHEAAATAALDHLATYPDVVRRHSGHRIEEEL